MKTAYLYGSYAQGFYQPGESDINVLVVADDTVDFHAARQAVQTVWTQEGIAAAFQLPHPSVRQSAFTRHLNLNPALAHHLVSPGPTSGRNTIARSSLRP
ncbi:MAG: nucleotidyltransferase domain-containing protein [Chloroflexi bacterium]|nr:nucleotidyltransferase domain-containing protein [Chloroflexota bacterium]